MLESNDMAYITLKGDFETLCKLINGDREQIAHWKQKFYEAIGHSTEKMNSSEGES